MSAIWSQPIRDACLIIPGRRPGFRSADNPFRLGSSRLRLSLDAQNSPAKVKKQLCGCRNSPKRCITGLVCIMSFQKKIRGQHFIDISCVCQGHQNLKMTTFQDECLHILEADWDDQTASGRFVRPERV